MKWMRMEWTRIAMVVIMAVAARGGGGAQLGINYGQIGNNLPEPRKAVQLVKSVGATHVKLYDANPGVLSAFANTGISFTLGLGNEYLAQMRDPGEALSWVQRNVEAHIPGTIITSVAVGNEVLTLNDSSLVSNLLPAMRSLRNAIASLNLSVSVTTPHSLSVLLASYPPSAASFRPDLMPALLPILDFLHRTSAPFLINAYPFFAYMASPDRIPIDFALFRPNQGLLDPATGLRYDNMLFSQLDAVRFALSSADFHGMDIQVSETGWPSKGDKYETGASVDNARQYNGNLIKRLSTRANTPMRPGATLMVYLFALFNENMKPGPSSERNYGLFKPDGTPTYDLGIRISASPSSSSPDENQGTTIPVSASDEIQGTTTPVSSSTDSPQLPQTSSTGYLSLSSRAASMDRHDIALCFLMLIMCLLRLA